MAARPAAYDYPRRSRQPEAYAEAVGPGGSRSVRPPVEQRRGDAAGGRRRLEAGAGGIAGNRARRTGHRREIGITPAPGTTTPRSEEHTSELQSLMRISYAVFCLKKKNK